MSNVDVSLSPVEDAKRIWDNYRMMLKSYIKYKTNQMDEYVKINRSNNVKDVKDVKESSNSDVDNYDMCDSDTDAYAEEKEMSNQIIELNKIIPDANDELMNDIITTEIDNKPKNNRILLMQKLGTNPRKRDYSKPEGTTNPVNKPVTGNIVDFSRTSMLDANGNIDMKLVFREFQYTYKNFFERFPVVMRYMIELGQFNENAFKKYMKKIQTNPATDMQQHITERNADYIKYLWQENNKKHPQYNVMIKRIWNEAYTNLKEEWDNYNDIQEMAKEKIKIQDEQNLKEKREELLRLIQF